MEQPTPQFIREMMAVGVLSYRDQQNLWQIAKRCAATTGITAAAPLALLGTQIGSLTIPGLGTITGPVIGALAGMIYGTVSCSMLNLSAQAELRKLAESL